VAAYDGFLAVLNFGDVEVLDFCRPFRCFFVANRVIDPPAFNVPAVPDPPVNLQAGPPGSFLMMAARECRSHYGVGRQ
jgi:hypothetical protein